MRRLSIIDLSGAASTDPQRDRTVWVVFNGEIYNYRALRRALQHQGHRFETIPTPKSVLCTSSTGMTSSPPARHVRTLRSGTRAEPRPDRLATDSASRRSSTPMSAAHCCSVGNQGRPRLGRRRSGSGPPGARRLLHFHLHPARRRTIHRLRKLEPGICSSLKGDDTHKRFDWDLDVTHPDRERTTRNGSSLRKWRSRMRWSRTWSATCLSELSCPSARQQPGRRADEPASRDPVQTSPWGCAHATPSSMSARGGKVAARYGCDFRYYTVQPDFRRRRRHRGGV